jgi:hypothetical protein
VNNKVTGGAGGWVAVAASLGIGDSLATAMIGGRVGVTNGSVLAMATVGEGASTEVADDVPDSRAAAVEHAQTQTSTGTNPRMVRHDEACEACIASAPYPGARISAAMVAGDHPGSGHLAPNVHAPTLRRAGRQR